MNKPAINTLGFAAFFLFSSCFSLSQADEAAERLILAKEYVEVSKENIQIDKTVNVTIDQMAEQFRAQLPDFNQEKESKMRALAQPIFTEQMERVFFGLDKVVADIFTLEELKAMVAFMGSDVGESIMRKLPVYMSQVQPVIINGMQARMPDLIRMLQDADIIPKQ